MTPFPQDFRAVNAHVSVEMLRNKTVRGLRRWGTFVKPLHKCCQVAARCSCNICRVADTSRDSHSAAAPWPSGDLEMCKLYFRWVYKSVISLSFSYFVNLLTEMIVPFRLKATYLTLPSGHIAVRSGRSE